MKRLLYGTVLCCAFLATDAAEPVIQQPTSKGIYRLPYVDGTEVKVFDDFGTHRPRGRVDLCAINGPEPRRVVAAAAGRVMAIQDYSHLAQGSVSGYAKLKVGNMVQAGTLLGIEGAVGCAMLNHVHFEVAVPDARAPIDDGGFLKDNEGGKRERNPRFCNVPAGSVVKDATYIAAKC